ncbi:hypothetical protein TEA_027022 [Camellia sinensis var. sinensis]|uniref:Uncharacterized protein n=1 Tax=Camellia sinensis var. sinensis TaxID=542762 RepID=A0A4S4EPL6_CAMSN|nr:hypothetical protein TEA_027022 [Camellia sinensis var. sinensis]
MAKNILATTKLQSQTIEHQNDKRASSKPIHYEATDKYYQEATGTTTVTIPQINHNDYSLPSSSSSPSSSLIRVIVIIASPIIVTGFLYLLIRFITRHFNSRSFAAVDDVVSSRNNCDDSNRDRVIVIIASSIIVTGFLYLLLRFITRHFNSRPFAAVDDVVSSGNNCDDSNRDRSAIYPTEEDVLNKIISSTVPEDRGNSFPIDIGSVSRRLHSIASFNYIVDEGYVVSVDSTHRQGLSDCTSISKDSAGVPAVVNASPGENLASEVAGRSWLRDYVDRLASIASRTVSFSSSGRFLTCSNRRSNTVVAVDEELEANRIGEEISELFWWFSGV